MLSKGNARSTVSNDLHGTRQVDGQRAYSMVMRKDSRARHAARLSHLTRSGHGASDDNGGLLEVLHVRSLRGGHEPGGAAASGPLRNACSGRAVAHLDGLLHVCDERREIGGLHLFAPSRN